MFLLKFKQCKILFVILTILAGCSGSPTISDLETSVTQVLQKDLAKFSDHQKVELINAISFIDFKLLELTENENSLFEAKIEYYTKFHKSIHSFPRDKQSIISRKLGSFNKDQKKKHHANVKMIKMGMTWRVVKFNNRS